MDFIKNSNLFYFEDFKYTKKNLIDDFLFQDDYRKWFFSEMEGKEYLYEYLEKFKSFASLLDVMAKHNWSIRFTAQNLERKYDYSYEIYGITLYEQKQIYLYSHEYAIQYALIHEIGHFLDEYLGYISKTKQWSEIKQKHRKITGTDYYFTDKENENTEYFANCFLLYINDPGLLQQSNQDAYLLFKKIEKNIDKMIDVIESAS